MTLQLRLGFWPVKSGQCSNVLPIVSVVGPNYQFQLLPTLSSMFLESLSAAAARRRRRRPQAPGPLAQPLPAGAQDWRSPFKIPPGMLHAGVGQKRLNCNIFKTLFRRSRLGNARGTSHARGLHGLTFPGPRPHADDPRPCGRGLRCMGRLFGSTVKRAPNIRIRWRPPSAHHKLLRLLDARLARPIATVPQVGTITVLNCLMAGAPASASQTPL